jgi:hypothetical protein
MINITTRDKSKTKIQRTQGNILVTDENGKEIDHITSLKIHTEIDDIIRADISTMICGIDINAHPTFNNTYRDDKGYLYKRVNSENDVVLDITDLNSESYTFTLVNKNAKT